MARRRLAPLFRCRLLPVQETWSAGPALTCSVVRAVLLASARVVSAGPEPQLRGCSALIAPEVPYSVVPPAFAGAGDLDLAQPDVAWQGRVSPPWRGVPCRFAVLTLRLLNDLAAGGALVLPTLVLVPDREPPGPRSRHVLLGSEFLEHYGLRVVVDYSAIRFLEQAPAGRRGVDPSVSCGYAEKD